jgi:outer membrane receptor for ferric coprogen and ferric-rhodotorulic acid
MPRSRPVPLALAVALALGTLSAHGQTGAAAAAAPAAMDIRIAAQPLAQALDALARQARLELMVLPSLVEGRTAPAVEGRLTPREALGRLLAGSGLVAEIDGRAVVVRRAAAGAQGAMTLAPVTVVADAEGGAATEHTGRYAARVVTVGKGEQALKDIPQSVSVVTRQLLDEQNLGSIYEALASTTGVVVTQSPQGGMYIYSRGFDLTTVQNDGVPLNRGLYGRASNYGANLAAIDRVEVLRGAAGLLQGEGSPGGAVNLVRKRPLRYNAVAVEARAGSWDRYGGQVDINRVLNEDGSLRGRVLLDHDDEHGFVDYVNRRNTTAYGTVEYDLSPATQANVGFGLEAQRGRPFLNGLPRYADGTDLRLARSTYLGATWNRRESDNRSLYFDVSHRFDNDWKLKLTGVRITEDLDMKYAGVNRAVSPRLMQSANIVARSLADIETSGLDANLTGSFEALGRRHELVSGANYARAANDTTYGFRTNYNIFTLGRYDPGIAEPTDAQIYAATREDRQGRARQFGIYNAVRWQLSDPLRLVVGARVSWFRTEWDTVTTGAAPSTSSSRSDENAKVNPYAGLIYALNPQWSGYVSYADIFKPQTEQTASGALLKPMTGANYEAGLKGELLDGRANAAFALFRIDQKHRAQEDFTTGPTCRSGYYCYTDTGKVRSQGADAEISGEIAPRLKVFSGYTFTQTKYLQDVGSQGQAFNSYTPRHMLRLWTTYQLPGELHALTVGGGVNAQSASFRQIGAARADVEGRAVWNALVRYRINRHWAAALNVNNVFDKRYYTSVTALVNGSYYGNPRNVLLTLRGAF